MAMDQAGIMALPEADQMNAPSASLGDYYDASKSALKEANPQAASDMDSVMQSIMSEVQDMSDEELDSMISILQQMHDNPDQYPQLRAKLIADGQADEEDLPPEYDPEFLAAALAVLMEAKRSRASAAPQGPEGFAKGGIASAAESLARKGRNGDTMLAHITPSEAQMLRRKGGSGTINPKTGLPEFFLKKLWKGVKNAVKKVLSSKVGKVIATVALTTFLGPIVGPTLAAPLAAAGTTLLSGGSAKDAVKSAAFAYFTGPSSPVASYVSEPLSKMGLQGTALQAATSGALGVGAGLLTGQKFGEAVKSGLMASAITLGTQAAQSALGQTPAAPVKDAAPAWSSPIASQGAEAPQTTAPIAPVEGGQSITPTGAVEPTAAPVAPPVGEGVDRSGMPGYRPPGPSLPPKEASYLDSARDWISKNILPGGIQEAGIPNAEKAGADAVAALKARIPDATPSMLETAYQSAYKSAMPGVFSTYGPITAAGIGAMSLMGGFEPKPLQQSETSQAMNAQLEQERQMLAQNPGMFTPKGFERFGAVYNDKGQITGWNPWTPESAGAFSASAMNPSGAPGRSPATSAGLSNPFASNSGLPTLSQGVVQPYNTASMYGPFLNPPRRQYSLMATGGIASLKSGGYPRKTGQVDGPGTETSDSIPAMLSDGEFVMTARAVRGAGNGDRRAGAKKMYALMHRLEQNAAKG